jgi:nucleoid-associated protein YgaU
LNRPSTPSELKVETSATVSASDDLEDDDELDDEGEDQPTSTRRAGRWPRLKREARFGIAAVLSFAILATVLVANKLRSRDGDTTTQPGESPPVAAIAPTKSGNDGKAKGGLSKIKPPAPTVASAPTPVPAPRREPTPPAPQPAPVREHEITAGTIADQRARGSVEPIVIAMDTNNGAQLPDSARKEKVERKDGEHAPPAAEKDTKDKNASSSPVAQPTGDRPERIGPDADTPRRPTPIAPELGTDSTQKASENPPAPTPAIVEPPSPNPKSDSESAPALPAPQVPAPSTPAADSPPEPTPAGPDPRPNLTQPAAEGLPSPTQLPAPAAPAAAQESTEKPLATPTPIATPAESPKAPPASSPPASTPAPFDLAPTPTATGPDPGSGEWVKLPTVGRGRSLEDDRFTPDPAREFPRERQAVPNESAAPQRTGRGGERIDRVEAVPHVVERLENFWTISRLYYGSGRFYKALWAANRNTVPVITELYVGQTIRIPPPEELDSALVEPPLTSRVAAVSSPSRRRASPTSGSTADAPLYKTSRPNGADLPVSSASSARGRDDKAEVEVELPTSDPFARRGTDSIDPEASPRDRPRRPRYRVRKYDTLRTIARDTLGNSRRADEILELNADIVRDPSDLVVGQILALPEDADVATGSSLSRRRAP